MSSKKDIKLMLDRLNKASNSAIKSAPASPIQAAPTTSSVRGNDGRQVIIGQGIKMSGGIDSCETLTVEGTFEATLKDAKILDVSAEGNFKGEAVCDEAFIYGNFDGTLIVRENLFVYNGARVKGKIQYNNLITERGAEVLGTLRKVSKSILTENIELPKSGKPQEEKPKVKSKAKAKKPAVKKLPAKKKK